MSADSNVIPMVPRPPANAVLADIIAYQEKLVEVGQYHFLGRMKRMVLEAEAGTRTQAPGVTSKLGHILEWYNQPIPGPGGGVVQEYVPIAQTLDRTMLLCLEPLLRRDRLGRLTPAVGLPPYPNPQWKPENWTPDEVEGKTARDPAKDTPPWVEQNLNQLSDKIVAGTELLLFQPVYQVLFQPELDKTLQATYWTLKFEYDPRTKTYPAFMVDRKTGAGHFYGGKFEIIPMG